MIFNMVAALF